MKKFLKKQKFPTALFVVGSIAGLALLFLLFSYFKTIIFQAQKNNYNVDLSIDTLKNSGDPMITRVFDSIMSIGKPIINESDPVYGSSNPKVNIFMFFDFTCSYCGRQKNVIKQIVDKYPDQVRLIMKDYPDNNKKALSWRASIASRCAAASGKYWEYQDLLFNEIELLKSDSNAGNEIFYDLANKEEIYNNNFRQCVEKSLTENQIVADVAEAEALELPAVPYMFVNDQKIMGEISSEELEAMVKLELEKK